MEGFVGGTRRRERYVCSRDRRGGLVGLEWRSKYEISGSMGERTSRSTTLRMPPSLR